MRSQRRQSIMKSAAQNYQQASNRTRNMIAETQKHDRLLWSLNKKEDTTNAPGKIILTGRKLDNPMHVEIASQGVIPVP